MFAMCNLHAELSNETIIKFENGKYSEIISEIIELSNLNNDEAQVILSKMYMNGLGLERNYLLGKYWAEKSILKNNSDGYNILGIINQNGYGVDKDINLAIDFYKKSVELKNNKAIANLGHLYFYEKKYDLALEIYLKSTTEDLFINRNLGMIYEYGLSTPINYKNAKIKYELAANLNDGFSQFRLANFYLVGRGIEKDTFKAIQLYERASLNNIYQAQNTLARIYIEGELVDKNYEKAINWLNQSIKGGFVESHFWLGTLYLNDNYLDRNIELGLIYLENGAKLNDTLSMVELARLNYYGLYMPKNIKVALQLYEKAALKGNINAIHQIALAYFLGNSVDKNYEEAYTWYSKLASINDERGLLKVAQMKAEGLGTNKDLKEASEIFQKLYAKGNRTARLYCYINKDKCNNIINNDINFKSKDTGELYKTNFLQKIELRISERRVNENLNTIKNNQMLNKIVNLKKRIFELEKHFNISENLYSKFLKNNKSLSNNLLNNGFNFIVDKNNTDNYEKNKLLINILYIIQSYNFKLKDFSISSKKVSTLSQYAESLLINNKLSDDEYATVVDFLVMKSFTEGVFTNINENIERMNTYAYIAGKLIIYTKYDVRSEMCRDIGRVLSNILFHKDIYSRNTGEKTGLTLNTIINFEELMTDCKSTAEENKLFLLKLFNSQDLKLKDIDYSIYINSILYSYVDTIKDNEIYILIDDIRNQINSGNSNLAYEKLKETIKIINKNPIEFKSHSESMLRSTFKLLILEKEGYDNYFKLEKIDFKNNYLRRGENKKSPFYFDCDTKCFSQNWLVYSKTLYDYANNFKDITDSQKIFLLKLAIYNEKNFNNELKDLYKNNELMQSMLTETYTEFEFQKLFSLLIKNKRFLEVEYLNKLNKVKEIKTFTRASEFSENLISLNDIFTANELKLFNSIKTKHRDLTKLRDYIFKLDIKNSKALDDQYFKIIEELFVMYTAGLAADNVSINLPNLTNKNKIILLMSDESVFLSYILNKDYIDILISRGDATFSKRVDVRSEILTNKVFRFRNYLKNPKPDRQNVSVDLYNLLIKPVEEYLPRSPNGNIFLSLNGVLRYIPFAAIYNGQNFLVEKYNFTYYSELSKSPIEILTKRLNWKVAGFGVSKSINNFTALPAVESELKSIIKNDFSGVFPGKIYMNEDFTLKAFNSSLKDKYSVYHLATHFKFIPGVDANSFFQLGNGEKLTVADLSKLKFTGVDLLTLSACDTALSGSISEDGKEISGITYLLQRQGAKSVISSLWAVNDNSTSIIMKNIYHNIYFNNLTKANALRSAQLSMLKSNEFSHPYYWAPFLLNGNIR